MIKDPKFLITEDMIEKCTEFANNSVGTSTGQYSKRGQFNVEKIEKDIKIGKLGEFGVYNKLLELYPQLTSPDTNIYSKGNKNWDADLKDRDAGISIGVKTQSVEQGALYGESWVFQSEDKGIFGKDIGDGHYVAFVSLNLPKMVGEIRGIVKVPWLIANDLFKPMKLAHL